MSVISGEYPQASAHAREEHVRNKTRLAAVLTCALGVLSPQAEAYFATGGQFSEICARDHASAQAYAAGVVDGFVARRKDLDAPDIACLPDDVTLSQIRNVACSFAQENPSEHSYPASYLIMAALDLRWPCEGEQ
jgi:Rap1a immunity proteins